MKKKVVLAMMTVAMVMSSLSGCGSTNQTRETSVVDSFVQEHPNYSGTQDSENGILGGLSFLNSAKGTVACTEAEACYDTAACVEVGYEEITFNTEEYSAISENGFKQVALSPLSTFSADVDTASYANVRRYLENGYRITDIPKGAVRTEELVNYFDYNYNLPQENEPFGVTAEISECPWNEDAKLVTLGLKTQKIDFSESPDSNIVFLIDVSGSMYDDNKLPLLVESFIMMLDELGEKDRVSIVTYAGQDQVVLEGVPGSEKEKIASALRGLRAGGGTNGGQGIISAYKLAESNFIKEGNNRVILATDGDLNIGVTNTSDLKDLIKKESETGVFLTILGFGMGNYSDTNLETMADSGNGNYAYIDSLVEAKKVLCDELGANMVTVAKDVKLQVEFNPAVVSEYRLIGYEDRLLAAEDFKDDTKDAGEIGAGHTVTAIYEIVTVDKNQKEEEGLKYQSQQLTAKALEADEWLTLSVRYKEPSEDTSKLLEYPIGSSSYTENPSDDYIFATSVAEFSQILRGEEYVGSATLGEVYDRVKKLSLNDEYKEGFVKMVAQAIGNE